MRSPAVRSELRAIGFVTGLACLFFGVAFVGLIMLIAYVQISSLRMIDVEGLIVIAALAALAAFLLPVGFRLLLNRINRHGSILGPLGWFAAGSVFAALTVLLGVYFIQIPRAQSFAAAAGSLALTVGCLLIGLKVKRNGLNSNAA